LNWYLLLTIADTGNYYEENCGELFCLQYRAAAGGKALSFELTEADL